MALVTAGAMILFVLIEIKYRFNPAIVGLITLLIFAAILSLLDSILREGKPKASQTFRDLVLNYFPMYLIFIYASIISILPKQDVMTQLSAFLILLFVILNAIPIIFNAIGGSKDPPDHVKRAFEELKERMGIKANVKLKLFRSSLMKTALLGGLISPTVFVNEDLLSELSEGELKSVLAHELAHYMGGDIIRYLGYSLLMYVTLLLTGKIITMTGLVYRSKLVTIIVLIVGFSVALSTFLILIRRREAKADLIAASYTDPDDLVNALIKIYRIQETPPFLPTHPSLEKRIEAIKRVSHGRERANGDR